MQVEIKKVGQKVLISHKGIFFEFSEDKYDYIKYLVPILKMLRELNSKYSTIEFRDKEVAHISDKELFDTIVNTPQKLDKLMENINYYERKLDKDYKDVDELHLSEFEKRVYKNNLELMRNYQLQRKINKTVYHLAIYEARDLILRKEVTKIITDATSEFMHILNSLKNDIRAVRTSLSIEIYMFEKNEKKYLLLNNPSYL